MLSGQKCYQSCGLQVGFPTFMHFWNHESVLLDEDKFTYRICVISWIQEIKYESFDLHFNSFNID